MYTVDGKVTVRKLDNLPQSSIGAPLPVVLSDEHSTLVAYIMEERDPNWDGTTRRVIGPDSDGEPIAIVRFIRRCALIFGPPNDEAFSGHPLASRGLTPYGTFEVLQSSWIRGLERMNSVYPYHRAERYQELRHFVLSFHDSTFECVAKDVQVVETLRGSMNQAVSRMAAMIAAVAK
jgi:hypothetical protein